MGQTNARGEVVTVERAYDYGLQTGRADEWMPASRLAASSRSITLSNESRDLYGVSISEWDEPAARVRANFRTGYMAAYQERHPQGCRCGCGL